jgi:hypothetical protein
MFAMSTVPAEEPAERDQGLRGTQRHRIREEICYLLARMRQQTSAVSAQAARVDAELRWWDGAVSRPLAECVRRGFAVRQMCLRLADSDGTWRNALSYIGDTDPADAAVCTYDYDRAEIRYAAGSVLRSPYAWTAALGAEVQTWYARTGMSAITAWLIAVARMGQDAGRCCTILTNRLYHETAILFELTRLVWADVRTVDDGEALTAAAATVQAPAIVFLDSSRPDGDAGTLRRVLREIDPDRVGSVVWDNTCAPAEEHPFTDGAGFDALRTTLLLLRSHAKLDQFGLELCPLGSLALVRPAGATGAARASADWLSDYLPDVLAVSGGCASPSSLRLLAALGLPEPVRTGRGNDALRAANAYAGRLLRSALEPGGRYLIEESEHRCFVEIHVLDLPGPPDLGAPPAWPPWEGFERVLTEIERRGAQLAIPIWKSASFGFHYTGLSWYPGEYPPFPADCRHTVLRLCVGMHDPGVVERVADLVAVHLLARGDWTAGG